MHRLLSFCVLLAVVTTTRTSSGQDLTAARNDQIGRLQNYVLDAIQPSGLVRDSLVLNGASFHPATPDAAGFALLGLSALDQVGTLNNAEQHVIDILSAHAGQTAGVTPDRSADGHFLHWMNLNNGTRASGGWPVEYTNIGSALLVAGAQFAKNHFSQNVTIAALADELTDSVDFNAAIHPSLDGRIYLTMDQFGGGGPNAVCPWNEYMLIESLALKQPNNDRARAVQHLWLDAENLPKRGAFGLNTLTDGGGFAPAFWVQQMHFFNGDFRHSAELEAFFDSHQQVDKQYSSQVLDEDFRYGLTAGVSPQGYHADRIGSHPNNVFSPEAVAAWGDMDAFLDFYNSQFPTTDPRYKYGLVRESAVQPNWVPNDAGLVDHLFLLFGLVESVEPDFFADRVFVAFVPGDFDDDGIVAGSDFLQWQVGFGDDDMASNYDAADLADWESNYGAPATATAAATTVPEPSGILLVLLAALPGVALRRR